MANVTSRMTAPTSPTTSTTSAAVGSPAGVPRARWTTAATPPPEHHAEQDVDGHAGTVEHGCEQADGEKAVHHSVERAAQVGQHHGGDGEGHGHARQREAGVDAGQLGIGGTSARRPDGRAHQPAQGPGAERGQGRLQHEPGPARGHGQQEQGDHGGERAHEPQGRHHPLDALGDRDERVHQVDLDGQVGPHGRHEQADQPDGGDHAQHVRRPPAHRAVAQRREDPRPPPPPHSNRRAGTGAHGSSRGPLSPRSSDHTARSARRIVGEPPVGPRLAIRSSANSFSSN